MFQQLLTEALLLAATGGALGLLLAYGTLTSASTLRAGQVPRAEEISIDGRVLLFAVGMSMLTGTLAGTLPAVRAGRSDLNDALKEGGRSDGAIGVGTRHLLIVCEVALSLVLLMGAGIMVQSLLALRHVDTGFDPNNVLTMRVRLVEARYPTPGQRPAFFEAALQRIRALPGVEAAGTIDDLPLADGSSQTLALEGYAPQRNPVAVQVRQVTPGYLRAMGIPVLRGRDILDSDADVLLVSQDASKLYWGADDAIGRRAILPALSKIATEDDAERTHAGKRASLRAPNLVLVAAVANVLALDATRQVHPFGEHIAQVDVLAVKRITLALTPIVAIADVIGTRIIEHGALLECPHVAACDHFWRLISDNRHDLHHLAAVSL